MITAVKYGKHGRIAQGTPCVLCSDVPDVPRMDHCHKHGWTRGPVCGRCNWVMSVIDRGAIPFIEFSFDLISQHAANCPDCEPIEKSAMKDQPRLGNYLKVSIETAERYTTEVWRQVRPEIRGSLSHDRVVAAMTAVARNHRDEMLALLR